MAKIHGKGGVITVGGSDTVGELQSWNLDVQAEVLEGYSMGDTWGDSETGVKKWSGSLEAYFDPDDAGQIALDVGDTVALIFYPGGEESGKPTKSGSATITGTPLSASKDGWVSITFNFMGKGELATGTAT